MNTTGRRTADPEPSGRRTLRARAPWRRPALPSKSAAPQRVASAPSASRWTARRAAVPTTVGPARATTGGRSGRALWWVWLLGGLALLLVLALLAAVLILALRPVERPASHPVNTLADGLLLPSDGAPVGGDWRVVEPDDGGAAATPGCQAGAAGVPAGTATLLTRLTDGTASALQTLDEYPTAEAAHAAFAARWRQLGGCAGEPQWLLQRTATVSGLGDEAAWVSFADQAHQDQVHVLLLVRTGRALNRLDVLQPEVPDDAARLAIGPVGRECRHFDGTCATSPASTPAAPPPGDPVGLLNTVDLPLVTPGVGHWVKSGATTAFHGTLCEGNLQTPAAKAQTQRSLIVVDDPAAPPAFGIDNVAWTFATPEAAQAFADDLLHRLTSCPERLSTAKTDPPTSFRDTGSGVIVTGQRLTIRQNSAAGTVTYHAGVLRTGVAVAYLLETPSGSYGLTEPQWSAAAARAALRAAELN